VGDGKRRAFYFLPFKTVPKAEGENRWVVKQDATRGNGTKGKGQEDTIIGAGEKMGKRRPTSERNVSPWEGKRAEGE